MRLSSRLCVLALLAVVGHAALADETPAAEALDRVFGAGDDSAREKIISSLQGRPLPGHQAARAYALGLQRKSPEKLPELKEAHEGALDYLYEVRNRKTVYKNFALVDLPQGISKDTPVPLVISLHSELSTAWYELRGLRTCIAGADHPLRKCIIACPNALNRGNTPDDPRKNPPGEKEYFGWGPKREGIDTVLNLLDGLLRDFNIDRDRIYLTGMGMGGEAVFNLAQMRPSQFAALCVRDALPAHYLADFKPRDKGAEDARTAASPRVEFPWAECYRNTRIEWIHANTDTKYPTAWARNARDRMKAAGVPLTFHEYEGFHGSAKTELIAQALAAMAGHTRTEPTALTARGLGGEMPNARHWWLEITKQEFTGKKGDWPVKRAAGGKVTATLDRERNAVTVRAEGVSEIALWLHDGLLDLSRPVQVIAGDGQPKQVSVKRDLGVLAESAWEMRGTGEAYPAKVVVKLN